jgi:hypothetical protein
LQCLGKITVRGSQLRVEMQRLAFFRDLSVPVSLPAQRFAKATQHVGVYIFPADRRRRSIQRFVVGSNRRVPIPNLKQSVAELDVQIRESGSVQGIVSAK